MPALYYIAQAGGISQNGSLKRIFLQRNDGTREVYDGQSIQPGDILFVPESGRSKFITLISPIATVITTLTTVTLLIINL